MHQALHITEILLNIFRHSELPPGGAGDLAVLARTCRTFKEPALHVLWEVLYDLSPLARCLPRACRSTKVVEMTPASFHGEDKARASLIMT